MIDREQPLPPYLQLAAIIRNQVKSGELKRGARLPSIMKMAGQYGVAQITVQKAIQVLKNEDLIIAYQGHGTFVAPEAPQ
jgi:DNA-binding GntR family transcriptional regulator